jgi:hypothetical protein
MPDRIEVEVSGFFTTHHRFETSTTILGEFTFPAFARGGIFRTIDGRELVMEKTGWLSSRHQLLEGETVHSTADRKGLLSRDIIIRYDGQEYLLQPEGLFRQSWYLSNAEGTVLLEIQPRGVLKQSAHLTMWGPIDADLIAFAYYLVHMRRQEESAAAAAAGGAAS